MYDRIAEARPQISGFIAAVGLSFPLFDDFCRAAHGKTVRRNGLDYHGACPHNAALANIAGIQNGNPHSDVAVPSDGHFSGVTALTKNIACGVVKDMGIGR